MNDKTLKKLCFIPTGLYSDTLVIPGVQTVKFKEMIDTLLAAAKLGIDENSERFNNVVDQIRNFAFHLLCKQNFNPKDYDYGCAFYRAYGQALMIIKKHLNEVYSEYENQFDYVQCINGYIVQFTDKVNISVRLQMVDADTLPQYAMEAFADIEDAVTRGCRENICKLAIGLSLFCFDDNNLDVEKELPTLLECVHSKIKFEATKEAYKFTFPNGKKIVIEK